MKVERRQHIINQMPERNYKKFQNEVKKYLSAAEREAQDKYCALWGNRLAGVRHIRGEIYTKVRYMIVLWGFPLLRPIRVEKRDIKVPVTSFSGVKQTSRCS